MTNDVEIVTYLDKRIRGCRQGIIAMIILILLSMAFLWYLFYAPVNTNLRSLVSLVNSKIYESESLLEKTAPRTQLEIDLFEFAKVGILTNKMVLARSYSLTKAFLFYLLIFLPALILGIFIGRYWDYQKIKKLIAKAEE